MALPPSETSDELQGFAFAKIARVLGPERAQQILKRMREELGIELRTPDDLLRLSEAMTSLGGFEAAVGAMLGVAAVLRGAVPGGGQKASA